MPINFGLYETNIIFYNNKKNVREIELLHSKVSSLMDIVRNNTQMFKTAYSKKQTVGIVIYQAFGNTQSQIS